MASKVIPITEAEDEPRWIVPEIGVQPRVPSKTYHRWDALSNSWLGRLDRSPAHLRAYLDADKETDTPAQRQGRAIHVAVLEPDSFGTTFGIFGEGSKKTTKDGKAEWADLQNQFGLNNVLTYGEYEMCCAIRDSVRCRSACRTLLGGEGDAELSVVWDNDGILSKARADRMSWKLKGGTIVDLKSTRDAAAQDFERSIYNFGYHRQAAWYLQGFGAHKVSVAHYTIIAVEKEPPYEAAAYRMSEPAINAGWQQLEPLLEVYRECKESGVWPGYPDVVQDIGLPRWAWA